MKIRPLGLLSYRASLEIMEEEHRRVAQGAEPVILTVEHTPVVTFGNRGWDGDVPQLQGSSWAQMEAFFSARGIEVVKTDRGGKATCHEPGQLVVYPIVPLKAVRPYVVALEETLITTCNHFGVEAERSPLGAGVWVGTKKIASIGVRVAQGVSRHGLAFNVSNSLQTFDHIVPCGLPTIGLTRLKDHCPQACLPTVEKVLLENLLTQLSHVS